MALHQTTKIKTPETNSDEEKELAFLRDEGLQLMASYKRIKDKKGRELVRELVDLLAGDYKADGHDV